MIGKEDPFDKAQILLDGLLKVKRKDEREELIPIIVDILKSEKDIIHVYYPSERDDARDVKLVTDKKSAIITPSLLLKSSSLLLKMAGKLKLDPRLRHTRTFAIVRALNQMLKEDIVTFKTTIKVTKKGKTMITEALIMKE